MSRLLRAGVFALAVLVAHQALAKSPFGFISFRKSKDVAKNNELLKLQMLPIPGVAGRAEQP